MLQDLEPYVVVNTVLITTTLQRFSVGRILL